jgi:hypothetical protein
LFINGTKRIAMKKILLLTILALIGLFVISSCSITLTKRHYRNGYFVEHRKTLKNTSAMGSVTVFEPPVSLNMDLTPPLLTAAKSPELKHETPIKLKSKAQRKESSHRSPKTEKKKNVCP